MIDVSLRGVLHGIAAVLQRCENANPGISSTFPRSAVTKSGFMRRLLRHEIRRPRHLGRIAPRESRRARNSYFPWSRGVRARRNDQR